MASSRGFLKREQSKGNAQGNGNANIDYVEVAKVAYHLYEERGCQAGHDLEDWLKAEDLVKQQRANPRPV